MRRSEKVGEGWRKSVNKNEKVATFHLQSSRYHHSQSFLRLHGICGAPRVRGDHLVRESFQESLKTKQNNKSGKQQKKESMRITLFREIFRARGLGALGLHLHGLRILEVGRGGPLLLGPRVFPDFFNLLCFHVFIRFQTFPHFPGNFGPS